jgi:hypothetical protein
MFGVEAENRQSANAERRPRETFGGRIADLEEAHPGAVRRRRQPLGCVRAGEEHEVRASTRSNVKLSSSVWHAPSFRSYAGDSPAEFVAEHARRQPAAVPAPG